MRAVASTRAAEDASHLTARRRAPDDMGQSPGHAASTVPLLPRTACVCGGGCPACRGGWPIQKKAAISEPGDIYEQEADRVASLVMQMPEPRRQGDAATMSDITPRARPLSAARGSDGPMAGEMPGVQRQATTSGEGGTAPNALPGGLGAGSPLDAQTRGFFESRFGNEFGAVRIHTDSQAAASARAVHAKAYTAGPNIVFGAGQYEPHTTPGKQLLAHELTHVVQQTSAGASSLVTARSHGPRLDRSVDDWLIGSVDIRAWTYTQLVSELDELVQYLDRQTTSSDETARIEEAVTQLRAEVTRRESAAAGPRTRTRSRGRARSRPAGAPAPGTEPLPARYPRILTEMTSVAYADPAEMRAEYDLIMEWLARPEISENERRIMTAERDNLAPQLTGDRHRVAAERHAERVRIALTPGETGSASELEELTRTILGIAADPGSPDVAYIYHQGERVAISAAQAQTLRDTLHDQLLSTSRRIESRLEYAWGRYTAQVAINDDHPVISSIAGFLGDVDDPGDDLYISYRTCMTRVHRMRRLIYEESLIDAVRLIPRAERIAAEVSEMSARYYEGYIEGAGRAVTGLEFTRDASFAIAGSIAAVVAAPVVAGAVGVGGLGLTGASATVATIGGTGVVVGTGMAGVRGTSAAGGVLLAGGSLSEAGSAFTAEAWRGFREGFLSGAGGAAARSVGLAINAAGGSLASQVATRVGAEMLINGTTTMVDVLARGGSLEEAVRAAGISAAQAVPGALLGGSNNPVVRNLVAPFTAGGSAYLAARANGASPAEALAQAGTAVATNAAMSRAVHTPGADAALVERGRSIGADMRTTVTSAGRRVAPYLAAPMIAMSDAMPPLRSGYGGASVVVDADAVPRMGSSSGSVASVDTTTETRPSTTVAPHVDAETPAASVPHTESDATSPAASTTTPASPVDDLNVDVALSPGAPMDRGEMGMSGRTVASGRSRNFTSLTRAALNPAQRLAAIRLHGQRFGAALRQAWLQTRNAREVADLQTIANHWNAGRRDEARTLARATYDRHRGRFWRAVRADPTLRSIFTDAGMTFPTGGNRPPVYVDPVTGDEIDFMSLEHNTRLTDDPTLALDANNLQTVLGDENSVMLEWIRRNDPFQ